MPAVTREEFGACLEAIHERLGRMDKNLDGLCKTIHGNGQNGFVGRIIAAETEITQLRTDVRAAQDDKKWLLRCLVGAVVGILIKMIVTG